jgi:hypothetical protein
LKFPNTPFSGSCYRQAGISGAISGLLINPALADSGYWFGSPVVVCLMLA